MDVEKPESTFNNSVTDTLAGKYLVFQIGTEEYGINIMKIREIVGMLPITLVPHTPDFVQGVINLRGKVIPVIDLRIRFSMPFKFYTDRTCIIVVEVRGETGLNLLGVAVDAVSEVLQIKKDTIETSPSLGIRGNAEYISGIAKVDHSVKILLDIERVLKREELFESRQTNSKNSPTT